MVVYRFIYRWVQAFSVDMSMFVCVCVLGLAAP